MTSPAALIVLLGLGAPTGEPAGAVARLIAAAPEGGTVVVPAGVHRERLRIDRSITLDGRGLAVIDGGGSGDIIEIAAADVTVRGLTVRGTGADLDKENAAIRALAPRATIEDNVLEDVLFGIDLREATGSVVRRNRIGGKALDVARRGDGLRLWRSDGALIEGNVVHDGRDAILWYSRSVVVRGNTVERCRYGLHLMYSDGVVIEGNEVRENSVGVYLMYSAGVEIRGNRIERCRGPSGYGLGLKETDRYAASGNLFAGNRVGVYIDGSPFGGEGRGTFERNVIAFNDIGITFLPSARGNWLWSNNFVDNIDQVSVAGRGGLEGNSFWRGDTGNFWSDYTGYDQDGDGVGDFVHESQTLFENMMDRRPELRLFLFGPAQQAVEFVGRALPAVRPEAKFVDEVPLMRPVAIDVLRAPGRVGAARAWLGAAGAALLAVGIALALPGVRAGGWT